MSADLPPNSSPEPLSNQLPGDARETSGAPPQSSSANAALAPGLIGSYEADVRPEWTRAHYDSALPAVFSTPAMIGMMEGASARAIEGALPKGTLSVGTRIEVDHLKAVGLGAHVVATARLAEVNGRFLVFDVEARSGNILIGKGRITHAVVDLSRFLRIASADKPETPGPA